MRPKKSLKAKMLERLRGLKGFLSFSIGVSREFPGYGNYEGEHHILIHRVMVLPLVVRVMWFERGEESFWE